MDAEERAQRDALVQQSVRTRRRLLWGLRCIVLGIIAVIVLDRAGVFGFRGNDRARFDRKSFAVGEIIDGNSFRIEGDVGDVVRLMGIYAPHGSEHWTDGSLKYLQARLSGRSVTIRLEPTQTRDRDGALLAYVYLSDTECVNVSVAKDGQAYADRRVSHSLRSSCELAETEARKKKRGLWKELTDETMPAWRLAWLRSLKPKDRS